MKKFLVTGAAGQIGSELTGVLRNIYGNDHVIAAGHVKKPDRELRESGPFHVIDCTKIDTIADLVEKYFEAVRHKKYTCYLKKGTFLDMMYMPDAMRAAIEIMEADADTLKHRNAFNVNAMTAAPETIAAEIQKIIPEFTIDYKMDPLRQAIADSWPNSLDDSAAREEWGWNSEYDLELMSQSMIENIKKIDGNL